jgi:hypothetical protein
MLPRLMFQAYYFASLFYFSGTMDPTVWLRGTRWESPLRDDDFPPFHSVSYSESMPVSQSQQAPLAGFLPTSPSPTPLLSCRSNAVSKLGPRLSPMVDFCGLKPMSQSLLQPHDRIISLATTHGQLLPEIQQWLLMSAHVDCSVSRPSVSTLFMCHFRLSDHPSFHTH